MNLSGPRDVAFRFAIPVASVVVAGWKGQRKDCDDDDNGNVDDGGHK